jgi:hypothetical protein
MRKLCCVLILWCACAAGQTVEGVVTDSITGYGVGGVKVDVVRTVAGGPLRPGESRQDFQFRVFSAMDDKAAYSTVSDAQGRFRIPDVPEGNYLVRYNHPKYLDETWAPLGEDDPAIRFRTRLFEVTAGGNALQLEARMIPMGRLTGRVVDGRGEPVPNARVDSSTGPLTASNDTDANGKFSMFLFPGSAYTLAVSPPVALKPPDPEPDTGRKLSWVRTWYPGVPAADAASKIVGRPGADIEIEIKLLAVSAHRLRGVLLNPDGAPAPKVAITLGEDRITADYRTETKEDGSFEFPTAADGVWRLFGETESGGVKLRLLDRVEVAGRDVDGLRVRLNAPFTVRGRVLMETREGQMAPKPPGARLVPVSRGPGRIDEPSVLVRPVPGGSFSAQNAYPGPHRLLPEAAPPGYYLAAVLLGEADVRAPELDLSSGAMLTLVYKTNGGSLRGTVENCASGGVLLVAQDPELRWPPPYSARCDSNNRYQLPAVRPGDYYAFAIPKDASSPIWDPQFDERLVNQAVRITVRAGETSQVDLRAITNR